MNVIKYISATLLGIFFITAAVISPLTVAAQSAQNDCTLPDFSITSSKDIYAIAGESFSYFAVTDYNDPWQLTSGLPSGLIMPNDQITGTPEASDVGEHELVFSAGNDCGVTTQTVNLTVLEGDSTPSAATINNEGSGQAAASGGSVALNDIPETGLVADTALTVLFYLLALLLIAGWFSRRVQYAVAVSSSTDDFSDLSVIPSLESRYTDMRSQSRRDADHSRRRFGDGMKR